MRKILLFVLCVLLAASLIANGILIYIANQNHQILEQEARRERILDFRDLFAEQVLLASKEIDFDNRLALETTVRSLNDHEILAGWQEFTRSETKEQATASAKKLLKILIDKTSK